MKEDLEYKDSTIKSTCMVIPYNVLIGNSYICERYILSHVEFLIQLK